MVRIDRISMQGFKSFANRVQIPFPAGFNVICGPNGSGKSNVVDAVTFVLGTLSTKAIRAGKLEDLIFKGGKNREGASKAVVSLYLDNSDGSIPGEGPEVKITRQVNRDGNSLYKLNGRTVTRKTIVEILSSARIHADGHNIIMQGDVTNLIKMSPLQRREIIDEVSGIAEFDDKKAKAEKELQKVDEKLKEARIILNEKLRNLRKLEKEKEDAQRYQRYQEDLKRVSASISKKEVETAQERLKDVEERLEKYQKELEKVNELFQEAEEKLEKEEKALDKMSDELIEKSKDSALFRRIHELRSSIERKKDMIESHKKEIRRIEDSIERLKELERQKQEFLGKGAAKEVLKLNKKGVYGTIGGLMRVKGEYHTAIEVAAGSRMNDIVVDNDAIAEECINFLKRNKIGRATFLPLNKLKMYDKSREARALLGKPGVIDFAINLVEYDRKYDLAFRHVFRDTLVVDNISSARKYIGKARMVTLDGDLVEESGAMKGGYYSKKTTLIEERSEIEEYEKEKRELEEEILSLEEEVSKLTKELEMLSDKEEREDDDIEKIEEKKRKLKENIFTLREKRKKLYEKRVTLQQKVNELNVQKARILAELKNLENTFKEFRGVDTIDADLEALKKEKKELLLKINSLGPINMKAIQEYEEERIIYDRLNEKVQRIEDEKKAVLEMAERVEQRRKEVFMHAFNAINENFASIFKELTGGSASLELENPDDIRSGLIIKAQPEGKKEISLDSMSGGEKTITALAFLFAVQRYKPAPFYILDEVEAALDKKNSKMIANLIQKFSKEAQFIVISHNDVTIKAADRVYGVSMEDGVSKVMAIEMPKE
ncbi:MAG: hypothetical protein DRP11_01640 [Candidatus Aenigmatarchaeota archaeon]|nr:MAG: hypothetical protein DRP11_01640 [Candidatus Aenigmarchaeota archaeon]